MVRFATGAPFGALVLLSSVALAQDAPPAPPPAPGNGQTFPGLMNPSISANGLFVGSGEWDDGTLAPPLAADDEAVPTGPSLAGGTFGTGLAVQEVEIQLQSAVDPYFKANIVLAIPGIEGVEIEEGYLTLVSIPRVLLNVGKMKEAFGRENLTHEHALLTIDKSLIGQRIFGEEGLNDVTVNAALLLPTPWYSEVTVGVDRGANEVFLGSGEPGGLGTLAHWKNLFDLSSGATIEWGLSGLTGLNAYDGRSTVVGSDLTFKSHGQGPKRWNRVVWQSEYVFLDNPGAPWDREVGGLYSTLEYSFARRFWVGGRYDLVGLPQQAEGQTQGASLLAVFAPTEFSALRLQGQRQFLPDDHTVDSVVAQLLFAIGVHPVHSY